MLIRAAAVLWFLLCPVITYANDNAEIHRYWSRFRHAVINEESEKVATMTKFPFWVRGTLDSDPVVYYNRQGFNKVLRRLLNQQIVVSNDDKTEIKSMLQVIKEKKQITPKDFQTPDIVRVELFRFDRINGMWLFTRGYLEE